MKNFFKALQPLYPLILVTALLVVGVEHKSHAGTIRRMTLNPSRPGKVFLAFGQSTGISFPAKPEKLSPGSPNKIHIEFVNSTDITVTPLSSSHQLGNLIVYTRSGRYVILFEGNQGSYDDEVNLAFGQSGPPLHVSDDTYVAENVNLEFSPRKRGEKKSHSGVSALVTSSGKKLFGDEFFASFKDLKTLHCQGCSVVGKKESPNLVCADVIKSLSCENASYSKITITRENK